MQPEDSSTTLVPTHQIYSVTSHMTIILIEIIKLKNLHSKSEIVFEKFPNSKPEDFVAGSLGLGTSNVDSIPEF
jgi:hypothetical protein